MTTEPDRVLVARLRDSPHHATRDAAFSALYERYSKKLSAHLRTWSKDLETIEDMVHDTFYLAQQAIVSGVFRDDGGDFSSWIFSVASNVARNRFRKKETELRHLDPLGRRKSAREVDSTTHTVEAKELSSLVAAAMDKIPARHRRALECIRHGSIQAVASEFGVSRSMAYKLVKSAKQSLADNMSLSQSMRASCEVCGRWCGDRQSRCDECRRKMTYRSRKADGLCQKGCGRQAREGMTECRECRNKASARRKAAYADRKARGVCVACESPAVGRARCAACAELVNGRKASARTERTRVGFCLHCEKPAVNGAKRCQECIDQKKANDRLEKRRLYESRKSAGLCVRCGRKSTGALCGECLKSDRVVAKKKAATASSAGLCRCGERRVRGLKRCQRCVDRGDRCDRKRYASKRKTGRTS